MSRELTESSKEETNFCDTNGNFNMNKIQNRIDANNKLFQIIKQDTKIDDLEEIADIFENYKDTNETLYKQVNDCSKEEIELEK